MTQLSSFLIGNETLTLHCGELWLGRGHRIEAVVTRAAPIREWAEGKGLRVVAPGPDLAARLGGAADWLLSIANLSLVPEDVLALAQQGAVNFHDGPLPGYAGLNVPVWALLAGEGQHGITWHRIEGGVDEGAILDQRLFEIAPDETALTLNAKCFAAGLEGFDAVMDKLETGETDGTAQDLATRRLFARADRPAGGGLLDLSQPAEAVQRMVRALDHGQYWNPLAAPKLRLADQVVLVASADPAEGTGAPGTVIEASATTLTVATGTGALRFAGLTDLSGRAVSPLALSPGDSLPTPTSDDITRIDRALAETAPGELGWRRLLRDGSAADLAESNPADSAGKLGKVAFTASGLAEETIVAAFYAIIARQGDADLPYLALATGTAPEPADLFSPWVPLALPRDADTPFDTLRAGCAALIARARKHPAFARDLIARDPDLGPVETPEIGVTLAGGHLAGTVVTLAPAEGLLHYDSSRIAPEAVHRMAARLDHVAHTDGAASVATLPILPEDERNQVLYGWNDTAADYDRTATLHSLIAAQAALIPQATALIVDDRHLSYAELNRAANRAAHVLRDMGVTAGTMVGLHTPRSPEMLIAALAILKAGGAYIPMDPAFPSDRLAFYVEDSRASVIVTTRALAGTLPENGAAVLVIDDDPRLETAPESDPDASAEGSDLAYMIYTSGSTGTPKGVMVEHRNVVNFFTGMDARIPHDGGGVWLAVTSLSFDISVLELFYTLARGYTLVVSGDESRALVSGSTRVAAPSKGLNMDFSLYYWGNEDMVSDARYGLLLEGAKFADKHGFCAVWTPERHFHAFGGSYPNPSVTGAAVAAVTENLAVRAGSIVAPLHHPARIAEEWAVIDNLTNGRVGLAMASGWQPDDFILRPENTPPANKEALAQSIDLVRRLWAGEEVAFPRADGSSHAVITQPRPVSNHMPMWVTTAGNPATWEQAGELGANVLTHLLGQSIDEVADKIKLYHAALRKAGHDPADFKVTLMLHTFLAEDAETAREIAREPMKDYLRSAAGLIKQYAWAFPAFKRPEGAANPMDIDLSTLEPDELEAILDFAFERYFTESGFFGTVENCVAKAEALKAIGVDEIACLIEYGIAPQTVLDGLRPLAQVVAQVNGTAGQVPELAEDDFSIAAQIARHGVTHLQCTPSMARMISMNAESGAALAGVKHLLIGGEALPGALVEELRGLTGASIENMYGPTETTIWSSTETAAPGEGVVNIGRPIANTQIYVLDSQQQPVPIGVPGEMYIGGDGVTRGYWDRPDLTAERFVPDPFIAPDKAAPGGARMYRTGDLVRWRADGRLDFLGRTDHQVKIRGYRIELGEIESRLEALPQVSQAVVMAREDIPGDVRLVAYLRLSATVENDALRARLSEDLPDYMIPAHFVRMEAFPLTPNKKVDRKALPAPVKTVAAPAPTAPVASPAPAPEGGLSAADLETRIADIWSRILGVPQIGPNDNFFGIGGHSLLAVQAHREIRDTLGLTRLAITDVFRFPTLAGLAGHLAADSGKVVSPAATPAPAAPAAPAGSGDTAPSRADAMARRREMRANRLQRRK